VLDGACEIINMNGRTPTENILRLERSSLSSLDHQL
jgi:hypothetical protein